MGPREGDDERLVHCTATKQAISDDASAVADVASIFPHVNVAIAVGSMGGAVTLGSGSSCGQLLFAFMLVP